MSSLCFLPATELAQRLREGALSASEVMAAHLEQIDRVNSRVNAIVTLLPAEAMASAAEADRRRSRGEALGPLHGLPVAHKDLVPTKGIRTTFGSPLYRDFVPDHDALVVERLKAAGAITIGKTNTPEFGVGSQTFNQVFGATCNPYGLTQTCGGSSGGAAVALACGMLPIADGSDTGGSLRNPANFCNVVGFRTSPGRVPVWPRTVGWFPIPVQGPMARTVGDAALLLSAMAGPDPRSPISLSESGEMFRQPLDRDVDGLKIAFSTDFGDLPVDSRVSDVLVSSRAVFEALGCEVEDDSPDFRDADDVFKVWRAWYLELVLGELVDKHADQFKDTILWNVAEGSKLTGPQIGKAEKKRTELYHRLSTFFEQYDYLVGPVSQVPPFSVDEPYVTEIAGVTMESYIDWMKSCYYISVTGLPAISVPCGFTPEGLPVGIQIVGRHHDDFGVLQLARAFEQATEAWKQHPAVAVAT
jgi:amidase